MNPEARPANGEKHRLQPSPPRGTVCSTWPDRGARDARLLDGPLPTRGPDRPARGRDRRGRLLPSCLGRIRALPRTPWSSPPSPAFVILAIVHSLAALGIDASRRRVLSSIRTTAWFRQLAVLAAGAAVFAVPAGSCLRRCPSALVILVTVALGAMPGLSALVIANVAWGALYVRAAWRTP